MTDYTIITMPYREYSDNWHNCKTVKDSYDNGFKTIDVRIPTYLVELNKVIPAKEVEDYRQYLIDSDNREFAYTSKILELFADDFCGTTIDDYDPASPEEREWMKKAIEISSKYREN